MAKINNVGLNLGQKIANPFKTSRNSTTNPFKYSNFEGNTLQFADVFEGFEPKKTSKLKMITSSVAGSMTKLRSSITEPIVNFVKRIGEGLSNAWTYAKNKNVSDISVVKAFNEAMSTDIVDFGKGLSNSISDVGKGISDKLNTDIVDIGKGISKKMAFLNTDVTDIGKSLGLAEKWNSLISKVNINSHKINKDTPVAELKSMWENEIKLAEESEAA